MTSYLKFCVTSNIVFMYLWLVIIEIKSNKVLVLLMESPPNKIHHHPLIQPFLIYFLF